MNKTISLSQIKICIRGAGDLASGVGWRLHQCGFRVFHTEIDKPMAVRRTVSFCEAVYEREARVEGVTAVLVPGPEAVNSVWEQGKVPVLIDPQCRSKETLKPDVLVDAILAKKNRGTSMQDAPLVIALGPGFTAGSDAHFVVETNRGHYLGHLLSSGSAEPDTGIPGPVLGFAAERVFRAPADGIWKNRLDIGRPVDKGDLIGEVAGTPVTAAIKGVIRGLIRPGIQVTAGLKIGDIDPRGIISHCHTISDKALAVGGGVLEGILKFYGR